MSNYAVSYGQMEHNKHLCDFTTKKKAKEFVYDRLKDNPNVHYIRYWYCDEYKDWVIDFGSHINFYFISDFDYKEGDTL